MIILQNPVIESSTILLTFFPVILYYLQVEDPLKGTILKHVTIIIFSLSLAIILTLWNCSCVIYHYTIPLGYLSYTFSLIYLIPLFIYSVFLYTTQERIAESVFSKPNNSFYYMGENGTIYAFDPVTATSSTKASPPLKKGHPQICFYDPSMNVWSCYRSMDLKNHFVVDGKEIPVSPI